MRLSIVLPITAAIALATFGLSSQTAAKSMTCQTKRFNCSQRCVVRDEGKGDALRCQLRTCEHQYRNCLSDAAGGSDRTGTRARGSTGGRTGPVVRDKRKPRPTGAPYSTTPIIQPAPVVQPRPVTTGTNSTTTVGQRTVRDHREVRP